MIQLETNCRRNGRVGLVQRALLCYARRTGQVAPWHNLCVVLSHARLVSIALGVRFAATVVSGKPWKPKESSRW
jgi:hypothetical protein